MSGPSEARGDTPEAESARNSEARDARKEMIDAQGRRGVSPVVTTTGAVELVR